MENCYCMDIVDCKSDYENFQALCPYCNIWNIFNRICDLKTVKPIWGLNVKCQFCNKEFRIGNDNVGANYQKLVLSCVNLISKKEYMQSIINLSIAYEMFFSHILFYFLIEIVELTDDENKVGLKSLLNEKIEKYTFSKLYNEFFKILFWINKEGYFKDSCIKCYIEKINGKKSQSIDDNIREIKNKKIRHCLYFLNKLDSKGKTINYLRNTVVHKQGYRPTLQEVEKEYKIARFFLLKFDGIIKKIYNNKKSEL